MINFDQASVIANALNRLPADTPAGAREQAERILLTAAENLDAADLARIGAHLRLTMADHLPAGGDKGDGDESRQRELWLTDEGDGTTRIRGRLDAEGAAALRSAIDPLARPRPTVAGQPDLRTAARRRADALLEVTDRVLTSGALPTNRGIRPQITVSVTAATLAGQPGTRPAQTGWGLPLSRATMTRLCCDASIARVVLNADSVPLNLGRTRRLVPPDLRRALIARDGGCAFPGCDRPPEWCSAHHIRHWLHGGATDLDNTVLVCDHHHRSIHHHGWSVQTGPDGRPEFLPPAYLDPDQKPRRNLLHRPLPDLFAEHRPAARQDQRDATTSDARHHPAASEGPGDTPPTTHPHATSPAESRASGLRPAGTDRSPAGHPDRASSDPSRRDGDPSDLRDVGPGHSPGPDAAHPMPMAVSPEPTGQELTGQEPTGPDATGPDATDPDATDPDATDQGPAP
jgi:hypothetical protein